MYQKKDLVCSPTVCLVTSQTKIEWMKWFTSTMDKLTPMWMKKNFKKKRKKRNMCRTPRFGKSKNKTNIKKGGLSWTPFSPLSLGPYKSCEPFFTLKLISLAEV